MPSLDGVCFFRSFVFSWLWYFQSLWCRTDCHDLSKLSCALEIIVQGKNALVEIIGDKVRIAWKLVGWSETAFWSIVVALLPSNFGEFLRLALENCDFAVYSNFYFLNNFLLRSQNKFLLVLGQPLRSVVYDFAFNLIYHFW